MLPDMEEKKSSSKLSKNKQPVKTEWGAQYEVFTYFQGDINSVVDEHFSRALNATKTPQDLSRKNKSEDVILKNDSHMTSHQWNFSPPWAKQYQTSPPLNLSSSDQHAAARLATDPFQPSILQGIPSSSSDLWHLPSVCHPNLTAPSEYPSSMPDQHMAHGSTSDGRYGSLLDLLQQERRPPNVQESMDSSAACLSGSARLQNVSHSLTSGGGIQTSDRRRDLYF
ncbi:transcription cofactor vestigial-like protein 1 [Paroedura picta]|uniref:transcription cofactor vestigial-like protein 1 n=1 Tax=Paroedura picta TaxID=143630 RepID=UPI004057953E